MRTSKQHYRRLGMRAFEKKAESFPMVCAAVRSNDAETLETQTLIEHTAKHLDQDCNLPPESVWVTLTGLGHRKVPKWVVDLGPESNAIPGRMKYP